MLKALTVAVKTLIMQREVRKKERSLCIDEAFKVVPGLWAYCGYRDRGVKAMFNLGWF